MSHLDGVCVLFEAGNRFKTLLIELQTQLPEREACICRELTKTHQEIYRKSLKDFELVNVLGEVTLVIGPGEPFVEQVEQVKGLKGVALTLSEEWGISKREAYNILIQNKPFSE